MSAKQRTVFTALPNGPVPGEPGRYRLSVHVAPQLRNDTDTTLATFPDWEDWPAAVNAMGWSVAFDGSPPVPATVASAPARSDLWQGLFGGGALVRSHNPPTGLAARKVRSYPAGNVMAFLQKLYSDVAVSSGEEFPHIDELMEPDVFGNLSIGTLTGGLTAPLSGGPEVEGELAGQKAYSNGPALTKVASDFYQLHRFHRSRFDVKKFDQPDGPDLPPVVRPTLDFHQVVSSAGQYPPLLRLLGLVVDLIVDLGDTLPASPTEVMVVPAWTPTPPEGDGAEADVATLRTRCLIDGAQFRARPRAVDPELVDGRLPLNETERFTLLQVDQDGAGLKAVDFAGNLERLRFGRSIASPDRYALPSLRSGGLAVARANRAVGLHQKMEAGAVAAGKLGEAVPGEVVLDAEDVIRGHRIDIRDTREGRWFSLADRTGAYRFPNGVDVAFADESWTTAAVTEDDTSDQDLYLQETLFRWRGWSLAVPRPGARLATTEVDDPPVTSDPVATDPDFPVTVDANAAPGSLPRLRFGRTYEVRARAVDLAGNSDPLNPEVEDRRKTPPADYLRFEPVQTPPVLPYGPRTEGESLERVVLRSNYDTPPARGVVVARHIVPPKADQLLAEQHGLFDTPFPNSLVDPATYSTISKYVLPTPPDPNAPVVQSEQGSFAISSERVHDAEDHKKIFHYPVDLVSLPYLPDPMAAGASLVFLDHPELSPGARLEARFSVEPAWPVHKPVRLVLREGNAVPTYDEGTHQIDVPLAKADVVKLKLSAYLPRQDVEKLGIWQWIKAAGGANLLSKVIQGRHWMVTPFRELTLVHAVRQPLAIAVFAEFGQSTLLKANKEADKTFVTFEGLINFSRKSTSRIDVVASWDEFIDRGPGEADPTSPPSTPPEPRQAVPFSIPGTREGGDEVVSLDPATDRQEFIDTRHRRVGYTTIATTRFGEYFVETEDVTVNFGGGGEMIVTLPTDGKGVVPGSVKVKNKVLADDDGKVKGAANYVEGTHYTLNGPLSRVTLKKGGAGFPPPNQVLTIAYLVPPIVRPGPEETMEPVVLSIKSSAPPAAPKVVYVVPTFGWESTKDPIFGKLESRRRGKGVRVYLERPWWSSGEGELLGVILDNPDPDNPSSEARDKLVTRLGVDPVFESTKTSPTLNIFSFPDAKVAGIGENAQGLEAPGVAGTVLASGHEVGFDADRDLWYCDIQINATSYFPFVKLGLARFQPESVNGMHLSPIVVTDFCQLAPDRFATVTIPFEPGPPGRRVVSLAGQSYERAGSETVAPLVRVSIERLDPDVDSELGWTAVGNSTDLDRKNSSFWSGQIIIPKAPSGTKQRLVIEEFERHRTGGTPVFGQRLVYSDIIDL